MKTIIQSQKIEELKTDFEDKEQAYEESRTKHKELGVRLAEIKGNLPGLERATQEAETRKRKALDEFVLDESKRPQLEKAREAFELAKKTEAETLELLEATERALPQTQKKMTELDGLVQGARHKFWYGVSSELGNEAKEKVGELIERAWVARCNAGGSTYDQFLRSIFPQPGLERIMEIRKETDSQEE